MGDLIRLLLQALQVAIQTAFVLLALTTFAGWLRSRSTQRSHLVLALGSLALVIVVGPDLGSAGAYQPLLTDITLVIFLLSGYALLRFRDSIVPLGRWTLIGSELAIVVVAVLGIAAQLSADTSRPLTLLQEVALLALLATWGLCIGEPIVRLWLASLGLPAVERARLRSLSLGYTGILAVVLVSTLGGGISRNNIAVLFTDLVALAIVPVLYVSFSPPTWLRRIWRQPEEDNLRLAIHDLLLYSSDRAILALRALEWAMRLVGGRAGFIRDSDGAVLAARGITVDEATELLAKLPKSTVGQPMLSQTKDGTALSVPLEMAQGEGTLVLLSGPFTPLFGTDEVVRLRDYVSSITAGLDRVALTARITELEKAKSDFLNLASHELRGPMTVIKGYLTLLEAGALGRLPAKAKPVVPMLVAKSEEVNTMIEQMIEAARLEDGRLALKKQRADVVELAEMALESIKPMVKDHELVFDKPAEPVRAEVDADRFRIVVTNLLSNAIKYSPEGGRITMKFVRNGQTASVAVTDQGIGIAAEDQARLFTRFGRIQNARTESIQGTGLGLWLSREIARMHGGDLTVESKPGEGSTFTFKLPLVAV